MKKIIILLIIPLLLLAQPVRYGTCSHWKSIQVKSDNVYVSDTEVPVVVGKTNLGDVIAGASQSDGSDIVVTTAAGVAVPCTLVTFNKADSTFQLYFKDPAQDAMTGGTVLYIQWGGAPGGQNGAAIWQNCHGSTNDYFLAVSGDTAAGKLIDLSGNYTATDANMVYGVVGKVGMCDSLNGSNSSSSWGDVVQFNGMTTGTVMMWVNTATVPDDMNLLGKNSSAINRIYFSGNSANDQLRLFVDNGTSANYGYCTMSACTVGVWYHVAIRYDLEAGIANEGKVQLFKNASNVTLNFVGTIPNAMGNMVTAPFIIGGASSSYHGKIDEVYCYNGVLDSNQIKFQYDNQNGFATNEVFTIGSSTPFQLTVEKQPFRKESFLKKVFKKGVFR